MSRQNISGNLNLEGTITSDDILGKDVIDPDGTFLGIVEKLHLDPDSVEVMGITVDKGFLKKGLFIGKGYIQRVTPHAVFLSIRPAYSIKGMAVFDPDGRKIGTVKEVVLAGNKNRIKSLIIRSGIMRKQIIIPCDFIDMIGKSVFLNTNKSTVERIQEDLLA